MTLAVTLVQETQLYIYLDYSLHLDFQEKQKLRSEYPKQGCQARLEFWKAMHQTPLILPLMLPFISSSCRIKIKSIQSPSDSLQQAFVQFAWAAIIKYYRLSGLNRRNLRPHRLEARSLKSRCWQPWFLLRPLPLTYSWRLSSCVFHSLPSVCVCPNLFSYGHQSDWTRVHPPDLVLT